MKWLQELLFNISNSNLHYSFICTQSNGSEYCYVIPIIQFLHTVKQFQVFSNYNFIFTQLNDSKYRYGILIIQFRHIVKQFQEFLFHTNNSLRYNSFVCTQLNVTKYCYVTLTNLFNVIFLHTVKWSNIYLTHWLDPNWYYHFEQWRGTPYFPKHQKWSLTIRCNLVSYPRLV